MTFSPEIGHYALILALALALIQSVLPIWGSRTGDAVLMGTAGPVALGQFAFIALAFATLTHAYLVSDFSVENVFQNSHSAKPLIYKISGVWGNHEGSMLLWVLILGTFSALIALFGRNLPLSLRANVLAVQGWITAAFLLFILKTSNPFARLSPAPFEGRDLNPVLQDPGLAIHPPLLYFGYVGFSVSFAFAVAALIDGRIDAAWARWVRPWTLTAWMFLTAGISMGSFWAYYELGWGGWWFWDPVENASFMPWLAGTALVAFGSSSWKSAKHLKVWTVLLAILDVLTVVDGYVYCPLWCSNICAFIRRRSGTRRLYSRRFWCCSSGDRWRSMRCSRCRRSRTCGPVDYSQPVSAAKARLCSTTCCWWSALQRDASIGTLYPLVLEAALTGATKFR